MRKPGKYSGSDKSSSSDTKKKSFSGDTKRAPKKDFGGKSRTKNESFNDESKPSKRFSKSDKPAFERDTKKTFKSDDSRPSKRFSKTEKPAFDRDKKKPFKFDDSRPAKAGFKSAKESAGDEKSFKRKGTSDKPAFDKDKKKFAGDKKYNPKTAFGPKKPKGDPLPSFSENIRLNKYLSNAGICSRREADVFIQTGLVKVNGQIITELGYKVKPGDEVKYDGGTVRAEKKRYVLLNKPKDFITTMDDPMDRKTVMVLVAKACKERIYPVGRLDRNTTGLLLFTNDGDLAKKLTHPRYEVRKLYHVETIEPVTYEQVNALLEGIELEDGGFVKADKVEILKDSRNREVGIEIHSGKYRVVRRMFETLGHVVKKLDRVSFAGLTKKDLPRGTYRYLTEEEVNFLRML